MSTDSQTIMNTVNIDLSVLEGKNQKINDLKNQVNSLNASLEATIAIKDAMINKLESDIKNSEKSILVRQSTDWGSRTILGTLGLEDVKAELRLAADATYKNQIEDLKADIKLKTTQLDDYKSQIKSLQKDYNNDIDLIKKENATIRRENDIELNQYKLDLQENLNKKTKIFKEKEEDLKLEIAILKDNIASINDANSIDNTKKMLEAEVAKLREELNVREDGIKLNSLNTFQRWAIKLILKANPIRIDYFSSWSFDRLLYSLSYSTSSKTRRDLKAKLA